MKEVTRHYGWGAICLSKPYSDRTGSAAHFDMSLADLKIGGSMDDGRGVSGASTPGATGA